ncbi:MAG TPA: C40 family peptidase [Epulopiscium sp.]|nr:C40 family peptidase [Candidatus Epulonipiscium sp.]
MISLIIISSTSIIKTDIEAKELHSNIFPVAIGMKGKVTTSKVNIRTGPDLSSKVVGHKSNTDVMVTGQYQEWYRIEDNKTQVWISKQYVSVQNASYIPEIPMLGEQIVAYGKKFIGTPYVWGGTNLRSGVDCSGFTQGIYKEFDIDINRTSSMQVLNGRTIPKNELKSGDLIFFDTNGINRGNISHVGVYVGDGKFIHSNSSKGISIAKLDNSYYKRNYVKSVRVPGI